MVDGRPGRPPGQSPDGAIGVQDRPGEAANNEIHYQQVPSTDNQIRNVLITAHTKTNSRQTGIHDFPSVLDTHPFACYDVEDYGSDL